MTQRPDDPALGHGTGGSPDGPGQAGGAPAEGVSSAEAAGRTDEDPDLQDHRTDVEDSPTGHS